MRVTYTGHEPLTFGDYLDLDTGKTLHAQPGRTYDIAPASGRAAADVPAPWFVPADEVWTPAEPAVPETEPEPQDVPEAGAEPEPPAEDGQSF